MDKDQIPLKKYRLLKDLLYPDREIYTSYQLNTMPFRILFEDLVATMTINPDLYNPPIVELENYGYMVRGNNIFYEAGLKAGLKSFICNVNLKTLEDKHMSQFQLIDLFPEEKPFKVQKLFFLDRNLESVKKFKTDEAFTDYLNHSLQESGFNEDVFFISINLETVELRIRHACMGEDLLKANTIPAEILSIHDQIRSVNGLIKK